MGRPRNPNIKTEFLMCRDASIKHGGQNTEHRWHRQGKYADGKVRMVATCMPCHAERNLARYHRDNDADQKGTK